jgi:hypothetical protein
MAKQSTTGFSTRLGSGFAMGIHRYSNADGGSLWMLEVNDHPTGAGSAAEPRFRMIASARALVDLQEFAKHAAEALRTDGGRLINSRPTAADEER